MRPRASSSLNSTAHHWAGLASSTDAKYAHISAEDKQKVRLAHVHLWLWPEERKSVLSLEASQQSDALCAQVLNECQAALGWLEEKESLQKTMKKTDDPTLVTADIKKKEDTLNRVAEPIMTKPAPKPKVSLVSPSNALQHCQLFEACSSRHLTFPAAGFMNSFHAQCVHSFIFTLLANSGAAQGRV